MKQEITAKRLQLALSNKGMTAQELCNISGVSKASISQYVNGSHKPSNISAHRLGSCLNVNPLWLMGFDVPMEPTHKTVYHSFEDADGRIISIHDRTHDVFSQHDEKEIPYYINNEARAMAQFMFENPEYKVLFDASRKISKEDIETVKAIMDRFKSPDAD